MEKKLTHSKKDKLMRRVETIISKNIDLGFTLKRFGVNSSMQIQQANRLLEEIQRKITNA